MKNFFISSMYNKIVYIAIILIFSTTQAMAVKEKDIEVKMKSDISKITALIRDNKIKKDKKIKKISAIVNEVFDYKLMSKISLGKRWKTLSKTEKSTFIDSFTLKLKASYVDKLMLYTSGNISVGELKKLKPNRIKLYTKLTRNNSKYDITYKFYKNRKKQEWFIYDVEVTGVSIIKTYRNQFSEFLSTKKFKDLLKELNKKPKNS